MEKVIRVIDGGGNGFRRADVYGKEVTNLVTTMPGEISDFQTLVKFACANLPKDCAGISYAMAGQIENGVVIKSSQIHWLDGVSLAESTFSFSGKQTLVANDMDAALRGMAEMLPQLHYFMGLTWSSGIGVRVFRNGEILCQGEGGHIHLDLSPFAPLCGCGLRGCVESICGGESVRRRVIIETKALGIQIPDGLHPCRFLDLQYDRNAKWAIDIYDLVAQGMGTFLANLQTLLRLPTFVWKGTFAQNALPRIELIIRDYMRGKIINPSWVNDVQFVFSPEPEKDSLIGAAVLF